jgi:hypothetical protein
MSEAISRTTTPGADVFSELIDLDAHPDGDLLRLCACLGRMRTATVALLDAIERTPAAYRAAMRRPAGWPCLCWPPRPAGAPRPRNWTAS